MSAAVISQCIITLCIFLLTLQLQTRMKGHECMLLPQGGALHMDGVSRLAQEHRNYYSAISTTLCEKQSSHVYGQNTE